MAANQSTPDLNRGLSRNFWWLKNANHVKFTEKCVMGIEKHGFGQKYFYKWAKLFKKKF